jgi:UDP-N-acetylmuramoyl-L-alanyl-D-glutamate--2,6-diaminopimelate ligase
VAARFYQHPEREMTLMGVTGTNGKTTITTLVKHLMEREGEPVGLIARWRTCWAAAHCRPAAPRPSPPNFTTCSPDARRGLPQRLMEVSSHGIDQQRVWKMPFRIAAFTNLTQDHIDYHKTMEAYFAVKAASSQARPACRPRWRDQCRRSRRTPPLGHAQQGTRAVTFGEAEDAEWRAGDLELRDSGTPSCSTAAGRFTVHSPLLGRYNVSNVLCALAMAATAALN